MQRRQPRQEARRWTGAAIREEEKMLAPLSHYLVTEISPVCRLFGHVHRQRSRGDRLAGELNALGRPVGRTGLDVSEGQLYEFPRSENGSIRYGNIEGVGWISPTRIVTVSDRRKKKNQPDKGLSEKDQSVHIFEIPS